MRVIISPIGSFTISAPLPARLHKAWDQALVAHIAQSDTAESMFAVICVRTAGQFAAVVNTHSRRVARQLGQLQRRGETLLHRQRLVGGDSLELRTAGGELLR